MSWIHLDDLVNIMLYLLNHPEIDGPVNGTAPNPSTNAGFTDVLGELLGTWMRIVVPASLLRLAVGEMAEELLLTGQRVIPQKLLEAGYNFSYPSLEPALRQILNAPPGRKNQGS